MNDKFMITIKNILLVINANVHWYEVWTMGRPYVSNHVLNQSIYICKRGGIIWMNVYCFDP